MQILFNILAVVLIILSVALVLMVILQSGKNAGIGAVSGGADTFFSKNKAKSLDAKLARWTKWVAIAWMVICLVLVLIH